MGVSSSCEKLNGTLTWMKCVEAAYLPEGWKSSWSLVGSAAFVSSSETNNTCSSYWWSAISTDPAP